MHEEMNTETKNQSTREEVRRLLDELSAGNADASVREQLAKALTDSGENASEVLKEVDANPAIAKALEGLVKMVREELGRIRTEVLGEVQNLAKSIQADNEVLMQGLATMAPLLKSVKATVEEAQSSLEAIKKLRLGKVSLTELAKSQKNGTDATDFQTRLQQYAEANKLSAIEIRRLENYYRVGAYSSLPEALRDAIR